MICQDCLEVVCVCHPDAPSMFGWIVYALSQGEKEELGRNLHKMGEGDLFSSYGAADESGGNHFGEICQVADCYNTPDVIETELDTVVLCPDHSQHESQLVWLMSPNKAGSLAMWAGAQAPDAPNPSFPPAMI